MPATRPIEFVDVATTPNQAAVAQSLQKLPEDGRLFNYILTLPEGAPEAVFDSLSGESHASLASSLVQLSALTPDVVLGQLRRNLSSGWRAGAPVAQYGASLPASAWPSSKSQPFWAELVGHWQRYGDGNGTAKLKQRMTGLFTGLEVELPGQARMGGSLGYTRADSAVAARSASADVDSYSFSLYGGKSTAAGAGYLNFSGGLAVTWHDIATQRYVPGLNQTLKANYHANTQQLFAELGYGLGQYQPTGFEPFANVRIGVQRTSRFQETGGFAALQGERARDSLSSVTLGIRGHHEFDLSRKTARVRGMVGWKHAFDDLSMQRGMSFDSSPRFTVTGMPMARNSLLVGIEGELELSRSAYLLMGYQGEFGGHDRDHSASLKLRKSF